MKYQFIKHNKTGSRVLGFYSTIDDVKRAIAKAGVRFEGISYMGGFPTYQDDKHKVYSVQGYVEGFGVVCSIPQNEVEQIIK